MIYGYELPEWQAADRLNRHDLDFARVYRLTNVIRNIGWAYAEKYSNKIEWTLL